MSKHLSAVKLWLYQLLDSDCISCWTLIVSAVGLWLYQLLDSHCISCWTLIVSAVGLWLYQLLNSDCMSYWTLIVSALGLWLSEKCIPINVKPRSCPLQVLKTIISVTSNYIIWFDVWEILVSHTLSRSTV